MDRREFLQTGGALVVSFSLPAFGQALAPPKSVDKSTVDAWLALHKDGAVTVYTGKVDHGMGTRTSLAQMAADELGVPFERVTMMMGDTATTPDQWISGASLSISNAGMEIRRAAATVREALRARAAERLKAPATDLVAEDGVFRIQADPSRSVAYTDLIGDGLKLKVDDKVQLKKPSEFRVIGKPIQRVDLPEKVTGEALYVHDFRLPGMLHARVVRPAEHGARFVSYDESAARNVSGFLHTVRKGDFVAVVAKNEWAAIKAARALKVNWTPGAGLPEQSQLFEVWRKRTIAKIDENQKVGDAHQALAGAAKTLKASYDFAIQTHASLGPSCAVADFKDGKLTVWCGSQGTHSMQHELAALTGLPLAAIRVVFLDSSGCYGRNGNEDCAADAALLATILRQPVRVQWSREDETGRSPKSPPRAFDLEAGIDGEGNVVAWKSDIFLGLNHMQAFKPIDFPLLASLETGVPRPGNWHGFLWQNATVPYFYPNVLVKTHHVRDMIFRTSHLRSPGRIENNFANESFTDEVAAAIKMDPAEFRLKYLADPKAGAGVDPAESRPREPADPRAVAVIRAAMKLAGWQSRPSPNPDAGSGGPIAKGRGIAYVRYNDRITYVAAVAEVEVNRDTGAIRVTRMCLGHDCGLMVNPDGVANQIQGGVIQTVSRTLMEEVTFDTKKVTSVDWATYPIIRFPDVPKVEIELIDRPNEPPWGAGEPMAVVVPAAIGNAVFDATGVRLRSVPFTPTKVKAALAASTRVA